MSLFEVLILLLALLAVVLNVLLLMRSRAAGDASGMQAMQEQLRQSQQQSQLTQERSERALREQVQLTAQTGRRQELAGNFSQLQQNLAAQLTSVATLQNNQIDAFSQQLVKLNESNAQQLEQFRQAFILQGQVARDEQGAKLEALW